MYTNEHFIFLADDDEDDRQVFKQALEELPLNVKVKTFGNGVDLMAELLDAETQLPDVIFLDLNMPLMNGEECLGDIRDEHKFCKIPIVIYSTSFDIYKVELLRKKGANRYIQKPKTYVQLKSSLKRAIETLSKKGVLDLEKTDFVIRE